jgi:peptide/nickel transport system ATP-binding protein
MYAGEIIEYGTVDDIFNHPKHPYTLGLFNSIPNFEKPIRRLSPISGLMPDPAHLPPGCSFAPRCPQALERCRQGPIETTETAPGHMVRCLKYSGEQNESFA